MRNILVALISAIAAVAFSQAASAADMATKAPPLPPAPVALNWTGLYVGGTFGGVWGRSDHCDTPAFCTAPINVDGITGGGTVGYNWQSSNWVYGLETDFSGSNARGTTVTIPGVFGCGSPDCHTSLDWFGTVRGRVGPSLGNWLPYVTGGLVYGRLLAGLGGAPGFTGTGAAAVETDWTVGGGIEYMVPGAAHWSVKLEYLYFQMPNLFYDTAHICGSLSCTAVNNRFNIVRLGANYRF